MTISNTGSPSPAEVRAAAAAWRADGGTVLPTCADGSKAPGTGSTPMKWTSYQTTRPTDTEHERWFGGEPYGAGLLCGAASRKLEMFELEGRAIAEGARKRLIPALRGAGILDLWRRLTKGYAEFTPSGGLHLLYRITDHDVPGNTKIAQRPARDDELTDDERALLEKHPNKTIVRCLAETRGEGGFVVVAPSHGPTHETGRPWVRAEGSRYGHVPTITWEERNALFAVVRAVLDEMPEPEQTGPERRTSTSTSDRGAGDRPGDIWARQITWPEILQPHGWVWVYGRGGMDFWRRPGKRIGISARTGGQYDGLYVWSTSTEFPAEQSITKFRAYSILEHRADDRAAGAELRRQGFGDQTSPAERDRTAIRELVPAAPTRPVQPFMPDDDQDDDSPPVSRFRSTLMRRSQLRNLPPIEPLVEGVLSRRSSAVLVGSTGAGKTFLALSWACSVGTGLPWLGRPVHRCPVLYVVGEGAYGLDARIEAWERTWQTKVTDDDVVFSIKPDSLMSRALWQEMAAEALDLGAGLVVLDTFSALAPDADETKDAATITRRMSDLSATIDGTSLLVHHPGWGDAERTRGGYQLTGNVDEVLLLRGNAQSDLIDLERQKVKEGRAGARLPLRRRAAYGSVVIEASTGTETTVVEINKAEQVARVVFGTQQFGGAALRDALMERLEITRSTAYERIKELVESGAVVKVGGTARTPVYEVAS